MQRDAFANRSAARSPASVHIFGAYPIAEWLACRPARVQVLFCDPRSRQSVVADRAAAAGISVVTRTPAALAELAGTDRHQGLVARCMPFPYADLHALLATTPALVLVADQVQDPQNLGALLRTANAVGVAAVILPKDRSVAVTPTVEMASAGAAARVPLCRVTNLSRTLVELKQRGYWSAGLVPRGGTDLFEFDPSPPLAVVVGGEAGLRPLVARQCDCLTSIPMFGGAESLNMSVAAAVALYEIRRRWRHRG